ncbi:hypothetical protein [Spirosoma aerolatum]|uniref:hypothetical protein n=1 Tax=Spirosoma aerolatum TaxID=1211326 RepID=UPI0009AC83A8|nr:hypothetical protein [Spirosoma aerolatum]
MQTMTYTTNTSIEQRIWGIAMIVAPLLYLISTFYWQNGEYTITGGTLMVVATVFWIPALAGLFAKLKSTMPNYASWGWLIALCGVISGNNFGMRGIYAQVFGIPKETLLHEAAIHSVSFNITMFMSGPLFPLSLLVLGIQLMRKKAVPYWVGFLLCAGAVAFPVSRIARIEWIAHVADFLLFIPIAYLGWPLLTRNQGASQVILDSGSY